MVCLMDNVDKPFHPEVQNDTPISESAAPYDLPDLPKEPLFSNQFWNCLLAISLFCGAFSLGIVVGLGLAMK